MNGVMVAHPEGWNPVNKGDSIIAGSANWFRFKS